MEPRKKKNRGGGRKAPPPTVIGLREPVKIKLVPSKNTNQLRASLKKIDFLADMSSKL